MQASIERRRVLLGLAGVVGAAGAAALSACTAAPAPPPSQAPATTAPRPPLPSVTATTPAPTPTTAPTSSVLPTPAAWRPGRRDTAPEAKQAAVDVVTAAGTWAPGQEGTAATRLTALPVGARAVRALTRSGLDRGAAEAVTEVLVAQMGGLLPDRASVMVVLRRWTSATEHDERTLDVRLRLERGGWWVVTGVRPARPGAPEPDPSAVAGRVLASDRVRLPAAAEADVAAGLVDDGLLALLLALGREHVLDVTVLRSGHPYRIFDKPQVSDHSVGRAADVWAVDGRPVVDDSRRRVLRVMRRAVALGAYQVGGPWDPGPPAAPYYTDAVHQDHLHLGVRAALRVGGVRDVMGR